MAITEQGRGVSCEGFAAALSGYTLFFNYS